MNRHQVLTGAANNGDHCYATGSVEGIHFTAYGAGCDVVILASDFQRVQILPGAANGNLQVTCVDCSTDSGKIAASYGRKVFIYEPAPLIHLESSHKLDYQWYQTGVIEAECPVNILSWNQQGTKLLTGGDLIQLWTLPTDQPPPHQQQQQMDPSQVSFFIDATGGHPVQDDEGLGDESIAPWACVWHCRPANAVYHLGFSTDGLLFASAGLNDRMVKVWYENKKVLAPLVRRDSVSPKKQEVNYSFVYIAHPRAITGFSWRKTSKYMPRGSVANMLITSCKDNICRVWSETIMPEDGLVDIQQLDPQAATGVMFHTHRHKNRFMQRLHHIRQVMHKRKRSSNGGFAAQNQQQVPLPSDQSVHDFHKFGVHPNSVSPGFHFHLAASINPETDIPLIPAMTGDNNNHSFVVHWLNNKELHFTLESERLLEELVRSRSGSEEPPESPGLKEPKEMSIADRSDVSDHKVSDMATHMGRKKLFERTRDLMSTESERSNVSSLYAPSATSQTLRRQADPLDMRIEELLRDWHQSADMLFCVHPIDGSYLVWLVDWLDEYQPGSFRQAQISFSSRIPMALPVGDAMTMSPNLQLYCNYGKIDLKTTMKEAESKSGDHEKAEETYKYTANAMGKSSPGQSDNTFLQNALMLSKHHDGSLNLWQISFADASKFSTVLSIAHASRACGHRFHTNSAACHPVLPLILTTSHHNLPQERHKNESSPRATLLSPNKPQYANLLGNHSPSHSTRNAASETGGFVSELILWRVDPVGPLSKSGGVTELARIDSPHAEAFSHVAWVPTLLPSSTLGQMSNSPSALFVASDGSSLTLYQSVIDARTLLQDQSVAHKVEVDMSRSSSDTSSGWMQYTPTVLSMAKDSLEIVSQQSTARPGCVLKLQSIEGTVQDWQGIQLIHIFQEQLITGQRSGDYDRKGQANLEALVNLQHISTFEEHFFLVVIEKMGNGGCVLHMWKISIASQDVEEQTVNFSPDVVFSQDNDQRDQSDDYVTRNASRARMTSEQQNNQSQGSKLSVESTKVCTQVLELPQGVSIITASVAAGHLSSSSIYPACFAPYLISTACSDGRVRFWKCVTQKSPASRSGQDASRNNDAANGLDGSEETSSTVKYDWQEWEMMIKTEDSSAIKVPGKALAVSCAYSGRVAVAYRVGGVKSGAQKPDDKFVNLCVSIFECESTGGSEWTLEDTIELKNINVSYPQVSIDSSYLNDIMDHLNDRTHTIISPTGASPAIVQQVMVPSPNTVKSIKRSLTELELHKKRNTVKQRHVVQLDWVSTEDGSHILTVAVASKIILYAAVSAELAQASSQRNEKAPKPRPTRGILQKSKSMTVQNAVEELRWMRIRCIELSSANGQAPLPMHISWVRDGILVVGMDSEMHVYTQWRGPGGLCESIDAATHPPDVGASAAGKGEEDFVDKRTLTELNLQHVSSASNLAKPKGFRLSPSSSKLKMTASVSSMSMFMDKKADKKTTTKGELAKSESVSSLHMNVFDSGMFESARLANPVLPQYHPKQLIELLSFGKIRRVKAILAHLARCISGRNNTQVTFSDDANQMRPRSTTRGSVTQMPSAMESSSLDYIEISSIPPLPLYALLAADDTITVEAVKSPTAPTTQNADYSTLFDQNTSLESDDDIFADLNDLSSSPTLTNERRRKISQSGGINPNYFGPSQASLLVKHLTHTHLPGLSSLDQMYLLALADTVANTKLDLTEKTAPDVAVKQTLNREQGILDTASTEGIDDCGLRFHLAARHHVYLMNTLPIRQRAHLQLMGLSPANFIWAFHSEAEQEMLSIIPSMQKGEPTWTDLRQFGAGWWLRNINTLRRTIEKVAKAAFQAKKDPLDAAVFYLAMKKKNVLWGLFRSSSDSKMEAFFKNNFSEERWRKAALKNAFALLGRQRFHHAAGFFLLAGAVRDAIEVCLNKLDDLQLAVVIARLYESELDEQMPQNLKRILYEECLGCDQYGADYDPANSHPDPFVRSIAYWMLRDYSASLGTLLESNNEGFPQTNNKRNSLQGNENMDMYSSNPSVFNFYNFLRTHPLLVRQQLASSAADRSTRQTVLLSGFSYGGGAGPASNSVAGDKNLVNCVDKITPVERRLYFTTAHSHFKNGCPMLALEVLSKLPEVVDMESDVTKSHSLDNFTPGSTSIQTGTLSSDGGLSKPNDASASMDWSQPVVNGGMGGMDWGKPVTSGEMDWSKPVSKIGDDELKLDWGDDDDNEEDFSADENTKSDNERESGKDAVNGSETNDDGDEIKPASSFSPKDTVGDIMAQQLKFIACLKVMMEELSTLATGFEVDGGQLRFQLFIWLEKEVEVLKQLTNYGKDMESLPADSIGSQSGEANIRDNEVTMDLSSRPTLHEVILAEKLDFENKLVRASRRKKWLKAHQQLLRTLLGYCVLHGAGGGGLSSVRMELILLLQELQQEKTQQQLLSPLPFPTSLPLLSASVASSKTVIADPIRHLQSTSQDLLHSVIEFRSPPTLSSPLPKVFILRNLSAALAACIYQSLCDSDNFVVDVTDQVDYGMEGFTSTNVMYKDSYLMAGAQRRRTDSVVNDVPNSLPAKWPGVSSLRSLLAREKDEDSPKLSIMLCESLVAVYMSLFVHALATYDANILYRLMAHTFKDNMWPALFGGGLKKLIHVVTQSTEALNPSRATPPDDISRQRLKLHMKVMGASGSPSRLKEDKPTYRDKFIPPDVSMITYLMTKPYENPNDVGVDYDSAQSASSSEDEDEEESIIKTRDVGMHEHIDANSYSWCLLRYVMVYRVRTSLVAFLPQIGIELPELPVSSPLVQSVLKTLERWEELLLTRLNLFSGPPLDYIPGCYPDSSASMLANKYRPLLDPGNTPFVSSHLSALPVRRLWHYLVKQESLQHIFIKYVFRRSKPQQPVDETMKTEAVDGVHPPAEEPMKIIHKEQDSISAFCINQANLHCIAVATPKEVVEMDITHLLAPPSWLEDPTEFDIECIRRPMSTSEAEEFLLVQAPQDRIMMGGGGGGFNMPPTAPGVMPIPSGPGFAGHTGRGAGVLAKRKSEDVRKMSSHPHLPYYLTGAQDGSVRLWEWSHHQNIAVARQQGSFPKVTKVLFNAQGNKFGVSDGEGSLCMWQVGLGVSMNKPYLNIKCHNKSTNDFAFIGSSSLLATAGHSSESKNVCLWDTLMPQKSALVQGFHCHQDGAPSILFAPQHQLIISGGKRGDVCIFDARQRQLRHSFQAHETAIRCMTLDPAEQYFVTGAADGDVKVWGLGVHNLVYSFPGEHVKGSLFRNAGQGVSQVYMSCDGHLFSCGGDGSLRVRMLPQQQGISNDYYSTMNSPMI